MKPMLPKGAPKMKKAPRPLRQALKKEVVTKAATSTFTSKRPNAQPLEKGEFASADARARDQAGAAGVRKGTVNRLVKQGRKTGDKIMAGKVQGIGYSGANRDMNARAESNTAAVRAKVEKKAAVKAQTKAAKTYAKPFNAKKQK
jgi:hypothetical protein